MFGDHAKSRKLLLLIGILAFALIVRGAMHWEPRWALLALLPFGFLVGRDVRRWYRGTPRWSLLRSILRFTTRAIWQLEYSIRRDVRHRMPGMPRGFCPKCGYPINPGICPECGTHAPTEKLRRAPPGRFRRYRGKLAVATILLLLVAGGRWIYQQLDWPATQSTDVLIGLMSMGNQRAVQELEERLLNGKLTQNERAKLINSTLSVRLEVLSPFPAEAMIGYVLKVDSKLPAVLKNYKFFVNEFDTLVDGSVVFEQQAGRWRASEAIFAGRWLMWGPSVEVGHHVLGTSARIVISAGDLHTDSVELLSLHELTLAAETVVEIVDRPIREFMQGVQDVEGLDKMGQSVRVEFYPWMFDRGGWNLSDPLRPSILFTNVNVDHILVGRLHVRDADDEDSEYRLLGVTYHRRNQYAMFDLSPLLEGEDAVLPRAIDLRFEPDASRALWYYYRGARSFCDQTIEWKTLVIPDEVRNARRRSGFPFLSRPAAIRTSEDE